MRHHTAAQRVAFRHKEAQIMKDAFLGSAIKSLFEKVDSMVEKSLSPTIKQAISILRKSGFRDISSIKKGLRKKEQVEKDPRFSEFFKHPPQEVISDIVEEIKRPTVFNEIPVNDRNEVYRTASRRKFYQKYMRETKGYTYGNRVMDTKIHVADYTSLLPIFLFVQLYLYAQKSIIPALKLLGFKGIFKYLAVAFGGVFGIVFAVLCLILLGVKLYDLFLDFGTSSKIKDMEQILLTSGYPEAWAEKMAEVDHWVAVLDKRFKNFSVKREPKGVPSANDAIRIEMKEDLYYINIDLVSWETGEWIVSDTSPRTDDALIKKGDLRGLLKEVANMISYRDFARAKARD
jgi:hypothetical protein